MIRRCGLAAMVAVLVVLVGCDATRGVRITSASAAGPGSTTVSVTIDACWLGPKSSIRRRESSTQIHLLIPLEVPIGGDSNACAGGASVQLEAPIGSRVLIDDRTGMQIPISPVPAPPSPIVGTVDDVRGHEAMATVTGWVVITMDGSAQMCDTLTRTGTACASVPIALDWSTGGASMPTSLDRRDGSRVSHEPLTLSGSLKDNTLYVGVS